MSSQATTPGAATAEVRYPLPRPASGDDPRFTSGLLFDVCEVIERHGYPPVAAGRDLSALLMALFHFVYGHAEAADHGVGGASV